MIETVFFRVRRIYFDDIVSGTKTSEVRKASPYWNTVVERVQGALAKDEPVLALFTSGRRQHKRLIESVKRYESAKEALGREPSEQGKKDVGQGPVFRFNLGRTL